MEPFRLSELPPALALYLRLLVLRLKTGAGLLAIPKAFLVVFWAQSFTFFITKVLVSLQLKLLKSQSFFFFFLTNQPNF